MGITVQLHREGTKEVQYSLSQSIWFLSCELFLIEFMMVSLQRKGGDEGGSVCFSSKEFDVCHGLYEA